MSYQYGSGSGGEWVFYGTPTVTHNVGEYANQYGCSGGGYQNSLNSNEQTVIQNGQETQQWDYSWNPSFVVDGAFGIDSTDQVNILEDVNASNSAYAQIKVNTNILFNWESLAMEAVNLFDD